jgi:hypothetical protein
LLSCASLCSCICLIVSWKTLINDGMLFIDALILWIA